MELYQEIWVSKKIVCEPFAVHRFQSGKKYVKSEKKVDPKVGHFSVTRDVGPRRFLQMRYSY